MRKSIFQMLEEQFDLEQEISRIDAVFSDNIIYAERSYTAEHFVDMYAFKKWKHRNRCINTEDMKEALGIDDIVSSLNPTLEETVIYLEYVKNILQLAYQNLDSDSGVGYYTSYTMLNENIDSLLDRINHQAYCLDNEDMVLICEKSAEATAVADILGPSYGLKVIRYNHHLLRGDIQAKRDIIVSLGSKLESKRKQLESLDKKLANNLFYMLNNLNLRHNNIDKSSKSYKERVAKMRKDTLEKWYDETYQLELLAFLVMDNATRIEKVEELKAKIES